MNFCITHPTLEYLTLYIQLQIYTVFALVEAGSQIQAASLIQAGGFTGGNMLGNMC